MVNKCKKLPQTDKFFLRQLQIGLRKLFKKTDKWYGENFSYSSG